ncbi:MFS transporter [Pseudonocardia acaciae]|uniref:MFS transporter n=1 Tax=Pseudonocardia acaciae TaxID=551276 RepID=UPI000A713917|nr:MFS transporter [Pseudonocardia acaciae]
MKLTPGGRDAIALGAICLSSLMFGLEISSVPVVLPTVGEVLHGGFADLQWVMNAYTIACTTVLVATGVLADRFGRRRLLAAAVAAFGVTSLLCGLASDVTVLVAGRFLQGVSGGAMLICQVAILAHQFRERRRRARAFGTWGIVFGVGLGFGPAIGGALLALSSWRWVFLVHVVVAAVTLALIALGVRESRDPEAGRLDLLGIGTLGLGVFGLVFYITQGSGLGFTSAVELAVLGPAADVPGQRRRAPGLGDGPARRAAGRGRARAGQHAGHQHHHRLGARRPVGHGLGHRHERAVGVAGRQHRRDGAAAGHRDRGRPARTTVRAAGRTGDPGAGAAGRER